MNIYHPTTQQRIDARNRAKELVVTMAGTKPTPDEFQENHVSKYPPAVVNAVLILCGVALLAAFYPSAMRLYEAGKESFYHSIPNENKARAAGISLIVMAELTLLICNLALAVIMATSIYRVALNAGSIISTAIALVGNIQIGLWNQTESPIAWLETIAPPLLVVILSFVLKGVLLTRISETHQWQTTFKQALDRWQQDVRNAEHSPRFRQVYANELKALYVAINSEGRGRSDRLNYLQALSSQGWSSLVKAALNEDVWYDDDVEVIDGYIPRIEIAPVHYEQLPAHVQPVDVQLNVQMNTSIDPNEQTKQGYSRDAMARVLRLFENDPSTFNWSIRQIAEHVNVSNGTVVNAKKVFKGKPS